MSATHSGTLNDPKAIITDLQCQLADVRRMLDQRTAERDEALSREAATAEVLEVINHSSPSDLAPVFAAMLEKATRLCEAPRGQLATFDGEFFRLVAVHGEPGFTEGQFAQGATRPEIGVTWPRIVRGERFVHIADVMESELYRAGHESARRFVDIGGGRSLLTVALRKDEVLLGALTIYRQEVRPFSDKQIALLQSFAAQAVIAMENAQLLGELRRRTRDLEESLEYQTATSDVLQVISRSTFGLQPVLDTLVETAARLCNADASHVVTRDGDAYRAVAVFAYTPEYAAFVRERSFKPGRGSITERTLLERGVIHVADIAADPEYALPESLSLGLTRTALGVPMLREGEIIGVLGLGRRRAEPFTERQIELVRTFAAQAVIAMENARLLTETREALERQTATAEVLRVINSSPGDLAPVFDAILEKAVRLCDATFGHMRSFDGEALHTVAIYNEPQAFAESLTVALIRPDLAQSLLGKVIRERRAIQVADLLAEEIYLSRTPLAVAAVELGGVRTFLHVPLVKDDAVLGILTIFRQEVRPFTDKQIALLQNFAAQAVIAMENARLITETREALEQQTATAEVLQVINSSPGDLAPVFDAMLEKAIRLCEATHGHLFTYDGESFHLSAARSDARYIEWAREAGPVRPDPTTPLGRLTRGDRIVHVADIREDEGYRAVPIFRESVELRGVRSIITVALLKDNVLLGAMNVYRQEVRPFSDKQVALLESFAAQAVIAMENARLIGETREALDRQTATAEVLQVINSSPGDLAPVFEAMLEKAHSLCAISHGGLLLYDGETFRAVATRGYSERFAEQVRQGFRGFDNPCTQPLIDGARFVHIPDVAEVDHPIPRAAAEIGGVHTALFVPLRKDDALLGMIAAARHEVRLFSDKEIALLQNFAAQAVIAMENARLITETREALEQQTATAEVLQVINSSPGNLAPVFDAMLEKALNLCEASFGMLHTHDGDIAHIVASRNLPVPYLDFLTQEPLRIGPETLHGRAIAARSVIQVADMRNEEPYRNRVPLAVAAVELGSIRTAALIPLLKDDAVPGLFLLYRQEVRPFSDKQIALLQNFAAQAVIAMENARLLTETREALDQQTATAEVLQVINSSPGDLVPVFDAMLEKATRLCEAAAGIFWVSDGEQFRAAVIRGMPESFVEVARGYRPGPQTPVARIARGEPLIHLADLAAEEVYRSGDALVRAAVDDAHIHTFLGVPLHKENKLLGVFSIYRREIRPFSDKQIALVQNFAAQAVIAMENARLLTETREALEQQTATAEVLQVINSSPGDLAPVFDAMLERAMRLCDAAFGVMQGYDGERFYPRALRGVPPAYAEFLMREPLKFSPDAALGRIEAGEEFVHFVDVAVDGPQGSSMLQTLQQLGGIRSVLFAALRKDGALLGAVVIYRQEARRFSDKQIALLQNFAAQAVVAMENARLLTETREALEQQTATAEVLQVINSSPGDLTPVFDAILEKAHSLCGVTRGSLQLYDGEKFRAVAVRGLPEPYAERLRQGYTPGFTLPNRRLLDGERVIQVHDWAEIDDPMARSAVELGGTRTVLFVALRKDDVLLGQIVAARPEVRPFSEKEIALLESFAAQAVIAIDNARLLNEIRQRQAELRVTFDNMGDGVAMFDGELRLAAWNLNFQRILDLPDALLAERPSYRDYLRTLAERGEFGSGGTEAELSRRLDAIDQELSLEHTRPDGRVIEVRRNAVPGGGFVVIYGDVTERKRAEEEIRTARDTAERALQELKTTQASLLHAQKMAALGQLTAGIAHEIKNPLNFVNNFAELSGELLQELRETAAPAVAALADDQRAAVDEVVEMLRGNLDKIAEHGKRADGIVKSMLEHSRGVSGELRAVDFNGLIEEALNLAYHGARAQDASFNITLEREFGHGLAPMELAPQEMTRVFLNLFGNGFYATTKRQRDGAGPEFRPTLRVMTRDLGDAVEVRVRDNGTGIAPEITDKLFQPFVTTKPTGEGTGLGLSIAYDIVTQQHGGTIEVDSTFGQFTEFTIRLPRTHRTAAEAAS